MDKVGPKLQCPLHINAHKALGIHATVIVNVHYSHGMEHPSEEMLASFKTCVVHAMAKAVVSNTYGAHVEWNSSM